MLNCRPQGYAALGRSIFAKPPALPEVADSTAHCHPAAGRCNKLTDKNHFPTGSLNLAGKSCLRIGDN
jgi:hypothetical protein